MTDTLIQKLTAMLRQEFADSDPRLEPVRGNGRVWGVLVWKNFEGVDQIERQERLWRLLRENLSTEEQQQVSGILTMTPDEISDD